MVSIDDSGVGEFRMFLPDARRVQLAGDFTGWRSRPVEMVRETGGWWSAMVALTPGDHLFQYLVDEEVWLPDYAAHGVQRNIHGGWVSQLLAPAVDAPALAIPGAVSRLAA